MRTIISPQNYIIVQFEKKFEEMIKCENGIVLFKDVTYHPEEHVSMYAKVISVPRSIIRRADYEGYTELPEPGDTVLVRYDVLFDYREQPDHANPIFQNCFEVDGEEYWRVDIMQLFAVKEADAYRMLNGYIMCRPTLGNNSVHQFLIMPDYMKAFTRKDKLLIRHIQHPILEPGNIVYCNPAIVQEYRTFADSFCIIRYSHIQGVEL